MRPEIPTAVRQLLAQLAPGDGPQLIFDGAQLERTMLEVAAAARAAQLQVLFAVKSFPHREVLALAATHLDGFDVASTAELEQVRPLLGPAHRLSVTDPTARAAAALGGLGAGTATAPIISCEDAAQLTRAVELAPGARLAVRLSSSLLGRDAAVGAVQSGDGHHRSRFGVDLEPERRRELIAQLAALAGAHGRALGLHLHHSGVVPTSAARVIASAQAALTIAEEAGVQPRFFNLGGAWHGVADQLAAVWKAVRAALPAELPLLVEPGRLFARHAGFALGWVQAARTLDDRELRVLDLSRSCHLRWSQVALVEPAPRPGHGRKVLFAGPTCYEDDVLGEWQVDDAHAYAPGTPVLLRDVTGYAAAWNCGFAGVPAATVRLVR